MAAKRPRQRLATRMRSQSFGPGRGVGLVEDRRGRRWAMCAYYAVRCELLTDPPSDRLATAKAKKLLRDVLECPSYVLNVGSPVVIDTGLSDPPRLRAGEVTAGAAAGAVVFWAADVVDLIEDAASAATRDVWGFTSADDSFAWHATGGPRSAIVLRRARDRMAAALAMPTMVRRPWDLEVVEP
jgi:hypothetical protein